MYENIKEIKRYSMFTFLPDPVPFNELFADRDIPLVQVHSAEEAGGSIVGFCGVFGWKDNVLTPLDHDSYNPKMPVIGYSHFKPEGMDTECLDIIVGDDW